MSLSRLRRFLQQRGGAASFADFMEAALYEPAQGYYSQTIKTVGRGGDFSTSSTLSPLLGMAIANWLRQDKERPRHVIEIGPGSGALALSILQSLGWLGRRGIDLWLVEKSPPLRAQQKNLLRSYRQVRWADSMENALQACDGEAVIYSNELVDAFPVILADWRDQSWHEVWLEITEQGSLVESLRPLPTEVNATFLTNNWLKVEGQRVEIPWSFHQWLRGWSAHARKVRMLTIDYGGGYPEMLARRPQGTLRGYFRHQRKEGPGLYENMGEQDITADVCFDDLINWGEALGWKTKRQCSQAEFVTSHVPRLPPSPEADYLQREDGAGGAFRVLEQSLNR